MAFATVAEVKDEAAFEEISEMENSKVQKLIDRAEAWIRRFTGRRFVEETRSEKLADLKRATILLVEFLWFQDQPDMKEEVFDNVQTEKIGSYSYTKKNASPGETTGVVELDHILLSLKVPPAAKPLVFFATRPSGGIR